MTYERLVKTWCEPSIQTWSDGPSARGSVYDLEKCKETCDQHSECAGFGVAPSGRCSRYVSAPITREANNFNSCYVKEVAETEAPLPGVIMLSVSTHYLSLI